MLTDIAALEYWLTFAQTGSEIIFFEDVLGDPNDKINKATQTSAAFAQCYEMLKREACAKNIYLSMDGMGRCIATKLPKVH